jgi:ABC-type nitrate/sulfonate/bicarbonate transport system substrate-binding protein
MRSCRIVLSLFLTFVFSSLGYGADAPIKLRVAYPTLTSGYAMAWITKDEQIFRKHGLDVELLFIQSSPNSLCEISS